MLIDTLSYDRNICLPIADHLGNRRRTTLLDGQRYFRITFDKLCYN